MNYVLKKHFELFVWVTALFSLAVTHPSASGHFTLCPLKILHFNWCPGCGLGHSISHLFHGEIKASLHAHWFGMPATGILLHRICILMRNLYRESFSAECAPSMIAAK